MSAGDEARFLAFRDESDLAAWSLHDLRLAGERAGALAVERPAPSIHFTPPIE